jgi:hypothetical protein
MELPEKNSEEKPKFIHGFGFIILIVVGVIAALVFLKWILGGD